MKSLKRALIFNLFLALFFGVVTGLHSSSPEDKAEGIFYIHARGGLVLRKTPDVKGEAVKVLKPGTKLQVTGLTKEKMTYRGWKGHWVSVVVKEGSSANLKGYVFGPFLSTLPYRQDSRNLKEYSEVLWQNEIAAKYESFRDDNIGHVTSGEAIETELSSAQEAFLVGRALLEIPEIFDYPPDAPKEKGYSGTVNPEKKDEIWTDELVVLRDQNGNITEFQYFKRWDGFGESAIIKKTGSRWRLEYYYIAD